MRYDSNKETNTERVVSNLRVDKNTNNLLCSLFINFPNEEITYDLDLTIITITVTIGGNRLWQLSGKLIYIDTLANYLRAYAISEELPDIPLNSEVNISGRIYLTNNTFFSINRSNLDPQTFIPLYFNV